MGVGLGSKSWWHSPNSLSSAPPPSRTPHALLAQGRMQSPSPTPAGCPHSPLLLTPSPPPLKRPWVKPPRPAHCHLSQRRTWAPFSLHSPALPCPPRPPQPSTPQALSGRGPALCSSPDHSGTSCRPLPSPLPTPAHHPKTTHHFCGILGAPPGGQGSVLLSVGPPGPDPRTWDPQKLKGSPSQAMKRLAGARSGVEGREVYPSWLDCPHIGVGLPDFPQALIA